MRTLETRLVVRLLTRTTRSVGVTEAGDRLRNIGPRFDEIETEIVAIGAWRDKPSGTIRITAVEHAAETYLWPAIAKLLPDYPDIDVEIISNYALADIVLDRLDAGVRMGEHVDKDMISVPISPELHLVVVAAPRYLAEHPVPNIPQELTDHSCIGLRLPTNGGLYRRWLCACRRTSVRLGRSLRLRSTRRRSKCFLITVPNVVAPWGG